MVIVFKIDPDELEDLLDFVQFAEIIMDLRGNEWVNSQWGST